MTIEETKEVIEQDIPCELDADLIEALHMAIASLEAWDKVRQEINDLFEKPAFYMPNYDAYKMFLEIIDKHLQKVVSPTWAESEG